MKPKYNYILPLLFFSGFICVLLFNPRPAQAYVIGQGGEDVYNDYETCDCSGATLTDFSPLYISSNEPIEGELTWYPGTINYDYYYIYPGAWELGGYLPLPECYEIVGYYCDYVFTMGAIISPAGSSLAP